MTFQRAPRQGRNYVLNPGGLDGSTSVASTTLSSHHGLGLLYLDALIAQSHSLSKTARCHDDFARATMQHPDHLIQSIFKGGRKMEGVDCGNPQDHHIVNDSTARPDHKTDMNAGMLFGIKSNPNHALLKHHEPHRTATLKTLAL